jgi:uncharacterized protein (TIGR00730 family)
MIKWLWVILMGVTLYADPHHHVGVFCSADDHVPDFYKAQAFELGLALHRSGYGLVTGGGNCGLMNAVANGFVSEVQSKHMRGAIPSVLKNYNVHHPKIPEENLLWTDTIYQRLQMFHDHCDTMVVLPGGFGTLHELMDFMVPKQWGLITKKIILLNIDHFWDHLLLQFKVMVEKNALNQKHMDLLTVVTTVAECIEAIKVGDVPHEGLSDRFWDARKDVVTEN